MNEKSIQTIRQGWAAVMIALMLAIFTQPLYAQCTVTPSSSWKNTIDFPTDPFRVYGTSAEDPGWLKFTILLCDPETVYFQDSNEYPFHYDFATEKLDPFTGRSVEDFNQATLYAEGQEAVLGAIIMPPTFGYTTTEYGIQFVGNDPYDAETIVSLFKTVTAAVSAEPNVQAFYFPTYEQTSPAEENREYFESDGIIVSSASRWAKGNSCYSPGWALGELKYVKGSRIEEAYLSGEIGPEDILLTDGVPSEVPFLAGIISLSPSTPNSHVAILASTYRIPFVYLKLAGDADLAMELVGHRIALRAFESHWGLYDIRLIDTEDVLSDETADEILALRNPTELVIRPVETFGSGYGASTDPLTPQDIRYFGGKAANFGFLRRTIPNNSPASAALSFNLWKEFLDQNMSTGSALRDEIRNRLAGFAYPPPDMGALSEALDGIRDLFKETETTRFTQAQKDAVIALLQDAQYGFDPQKKIRFRSSTNVEDSEQFTGAGLYDSYSGCLADELDSDEDGPSVCDPSKSDERGVFRAIRKVFASFYNDNAFLERLRHGVSENDVGMAILVHHSFPDETELANGVATFTKGEWNTDIKLVTQTGAVSVTNPEDGSVPEEVSVYTSSYDDSIYPSLIQPSNLMQLGAKVMAWEDDYTDLSRMLVSIAEAFEKETGKTLYTLDFEYKKITPDGKLVVKQVREIPQPGTTRNITPFIISEPTEYCVLQGENADVFALHRLKSRLTLETGSFQMSDENLGKSFFTIADLEYTADGNILTQSGELADWPGAAYEFEDHAAISGWKFSDISNPRSYQVIVENVGNPVSSSENPLLTIGDLGNLVLRAEYETPVPTAWNWTGETPTTISDEVFIQPCFRESENDILQERTLEGSDGLTIRTSFYWPEPPSGPSAGYTAPLVRWKETVIEGLTSRPVTLRSGYSQTYQPGHHNFWEEFIFEPFLDPDVPADLLAELQKQNIRMIHAVFSDMEDPRFTFYPGLTHHSADYNPKDYEISLSELLRVIQLYYNGSYHCSPDGEDGYASGEGDKNCSPHMSDYNPQDWSIGLDELLRIIQFHISSGYGVDADEEDGFSPLE